jgi:hypothetical protein
MLTKFKAGDRVTITRINPRATCGWVAAMDKTLYCVGIILSNNNRSDSYYVRVALPTSGYQEWYYPENCLQLSEEVGPAPTKEHLICVKIKQMEQRRKELGYAF